MMPIALRQTSSRAKTAIFRRMYTTKQDVSFQELRQLIHGVGKSPYTLIDVREPDEVAQGKVPTATNIPLGEVATAFSLSNDQFKSKYGIDKPSPSIETIFYCRSGKRSQSAIDQVEKISPDLVIRNYRGSWLNYSENALSGQSLV